MEGKGTVFTVDIPMTVVEEPSADLVQEPRITQQTVVEELEDMETEEQIPDENKECILIIDDNADVRDYVKSLLKEEYTVIEAPDGRAGLKKAMKYVPDAIICDVMMPVMDGLECCRKLKTELQTSHIPVMLLTLVRWMNSGYRDLSVGRILISPNPLIPNCCWYVFVI